MSIHPQDAKQVGLDDSNIANYGSKEHKSVRKDAAESEKEWTGAGKEPGIEVWRIEAFHVKRQPKKEFGTFYEGDSYIVLYTYKDKESKKLKFNVHFWLGRHTTQDEYGTAAYKTVELDDLLDDAPVQYREVQGSESQEFRALFPRMMILKGGVASGFNEVKAVDYAPRLLHVKGRNNVVVRQVALSHKSLNAGDCFILDAGLRIWQWKGPQSNHFEWQRSTETVAAIKDQRNGKPTSKVLDADDDDPEFWKLLGGKPAVIPAAIPDAEQLPQQNALYRLSDAKGKMEFTRVAVGAELKRAQLDSNDVFVVDVGTVVYVWVGKGASKDERKKAMTYASDYLQKSDKPPATPVVRVVEGGEEPADFRKAFVGPAAPAGPAGPGAEAKAPAAPQKYVPVVSEGVAEVTVHGASDLRDVQLVGKQDPYAVVQVGKQSHKHKTKVAEDQVKNPVWDATFRLSLHTNEKETTIVVMNDNVMFDKEIGRATIALDQLKHSFAKLELKLEYEGQPCGSVCLSNVYHPPAKITVLEAKDLHNVQLIGRMDPYVMFKVGEEWFRTLTHEDGGATPKWTEANVFYFNNEAYEADVHVLVEVKDENVMKDTFIGKYELTVGQIGKLVKEGGKGAHWFDLTRKDGTGAGSLALAFN